MSAEIKAKIGILGGTFNPIHFGHLHIAREAAAHLDLRPVLFVPSGAPPHKSGDLESAEHRLRMTALAIQGEARFAVSDVEVRRPGASYTIDTLNEIRRDFGEQNEYYFIIGADSIRELPGWRAASELLNLCTFVAVTRPGSTLEVSTEVEAKLGPAHAQRLRDNALAVEGIRAASTEIRRRLAAGNPVDSQLPHGVITYIRTHHLYGT